MSSFILAPCLLLQATPLCPSCWQVCILGLSSRARPHQHEVGTVHCTRPQQRKCTENTWQVADSSEFKFLSDGDDDIRIQHG